MINLTKYLSNGQAVGHYEVPPSVCVILAEVADGEGEGGGDEVDGVHDCQS